jgi:hypothetical protein
LNVGDEIECTCPRCKLVLPHVILYFDKDGSIGAVQCRTCGMDHPYLSHSRGRVRRPPPSGETLRALLEGGSYEERISQLDPEKVIPYRTDGVYSVEDAVSHKKFGIGFVLRVRPERIEVLFRKGIKVLLAGNRNPSP